MKSTFLAIGLSLAAATAAHAQLSYNTMNLNYIHGVSNIDGVDGLDGGSLEFSYSPIKHLFLTAGAGMMTVDTVFGDIDGYALGGSVGGYLPLGSEKLHLAGELGVSFNDLDTPGNSRGDVGIHVSPYLRWAPMDALELRVGVAYSSIDESDEFTGILDGYAEIFESVDLHGGLSFGSDITEISAGVRLRF
jgi:hypothetical protein